MSRNFELLKQAGTTLEVELVPKLQTAPAVVKSNGNGHRNNSGLNIDRLVSDESLKLVQRLFLMQMGASPRSVVFAGIDQGNGCSRMCATAAQTLAENVSGSVCVVDANLRAPSLAQFFGVAHHRGLADFAVGENPIQNFTQRLRPDNLWLLPCGSQAFDSENLLKSDRLKTWLPQLRDAFDYILIDAPPLNQYAEAIGLGQLADGLVLVLEANATRRESALRVTEMLRAAQVQVLGAVLNKRTFPIPQSLYHRL
ncbi:MAG: CpsD/CapB family tyrosine-protein kinase [Candidatus Acidiferrales bacterium]